MAMELMQLLQHPRGWSVPWLALAGSLLACCSLLFSVVVISFWSCESTTSPSAGALLCVPDSRGSAKPYMFLAATGFFPGATHPSMPSTINSETSKCLSEIIILITSETPRMCCVLRSSCCVKAFCTLGFLSVHMRFWDSPKVDLSVNLRSLTVLSILCMVAQVDFAHLQIMTQMGSHLHCGGEPCGYRQRLAHEHPRRRQSTMAAARRMLRPQAQHEGRT